jgi:mono/diheme cytochrome c family protein
MSGRRLAVAVIATVLGGGLAGAAAQTSLARPTGDAAHGKTLFNDTYRCYACHGYDGQTGSPRLVPMPMAEEAFIAFLRKPSRETMPKFVDVPQRDLADVYAYIRSLPVAAPPAESIPLLKDVLDRRARTTQRGK